jgi:hypothetical protein
MSACLIIGPGYNSFGGPLASMMKITIQVHLLNDPEQSLHASFADADGLDGTEFDRRRTYYW